MRQGGFAVPALAVVVAVVMLALTGLSVDLWRVIASHQRLVAVTDAAAVAGSQAVDVGSIYAGAPGAPTLDPDGAIELACEYLIRKLTSDECPGPDVAVIVELDSVTVRARTIISPTLLALLLAPVGRGRDIEVAAASTAVAVSVITNGE